MHTYLCYFRLELSRIETDGLVKPNRRDDPNKVRAVYSITAAYPPV